MAKYEPLSRYLLGARHPVTLTFEDMSGLVRGLPMSAYRHRAWWANSRSLVQARSWLEVGREVANVDLEGLVVRFSWSRRAEDYQDARVLWSDALGPRPSDAAAMRYRCRVATRRMLRSTEPRAATLRKVAAVEGLAWDASPRGTRPQALVLRNAVDRLSPVD